MSVKLLWPLLLSHSDKFTLNDASLKHLMKEPKGERSVAIGDWLAFLKMVLKGDILKAIKTGTFDKESNQSVLSLRMLCLTEMGVKQVMPTSVRRARLCSRSTKRTQIPGRSSRVECQSSLKQLPLWPMPLICLATRPMWTWGVSALPYFEKSSCMNTHWVNVSHLKCHLLSSAGGNGTFAVAMKKTYPHMDITIADLPRVMEGAKQIPANHEAGIKFHPGEFSGSVLQWMKCHRQNAFLFQWTFWWMRCQKLTSWASTTSCTTGPMKAAE